MKLNNRGFAISTMMYMILVLALLIMTLVLAILNSRSKILNNLKEKVQNEVNDTSVNTNYICIGVNKYDAYEVGDLYDCDVSNTESYQFYIIKDNDTTVDFVMSEPLTFDIGDYGKVDDVKTESKVAYITENDYNEYNIYNPITALKVLKRITDNWFYLDVRTDSIINNGLSIDYKNYRARLLSFSDISQYIEDNSLKLDFIKDTMTSTIYNDDKIYSIVNNTVSVSASASEEYNIVPVITVSKDKIKK